jgi:hypothetical protein
MTESSGAVVAITQLVNLYGLAVDSRRWELFDRIFAADVDADYGPTSHWTDREEFKADFAAFHEPFDSTQHTMSTHVVHVDGDRAHSFCNGGWRLVRRAAGGDPCGTAPAGMTTRCCAPRQAGGSSAGCAASRGGPATRSSTRRLPGSSSNWAPPCCGARQTPGASVSSARCSPNRRPSAAPQPVAPLARVNCAMSV